MDKSFYWMTNLDKEFRSYAYEGFGEAIGEVFKNGIIADYLSNRVPGEYEDFYFKGLKKKNIQIQKRGKRVLVIAPHPDDEALGCAKVISDAVDKGYPVKVLLMTNGDVLFYKKKNLYDFDCNGSIDYIDYGYIRQQETVKAMGKLGLNSKNIIFLGYPDAYLWDLYNCKYNGIFFSIKNPLKITPVLNSGTTFISPYKNSYHSLVYSGEPTVYSRGYVINDLKEIFKSFKPTDIYMTFEFDAHPDHKIIPLFIRKVLEELKDSNEEFAFRIKLHRYLIHFNGKNNYPDPNSQRLRIWDDRNCKPVRWEDTKIMYAPNGSISLNSEFKKLKYEVINCYSTQDPQEVPKGQTQCSKEIRYSWLQRFVKDREEWWDMPTDFNIPLSHFDQLSRAKKIIFYIKTFLRASKLEVRRYLFNKVIKQKIATSKTHFPPTFS